VHELKYSLNWPVAYNRRPLRKTQVLINCDFEQVSHGKKRKRKKQKRYEVSRLEERSGPTKHILRQKSREVDREAMGVVAQGCVPAGHAKMQVTIIKRSFTDIKPLQ